MRKHKSGRGFSLTELLAVIAIIVIIMSLLVVGTQAVYTHVITLKCQHHMEQIWQASAMYASKSHGFLPAAWDYVATRAWYDTLTRCKYIDNTTVLQCPVSDIAMTATTGGQTSNMPNNMRDTITKTLDWFKANQRSDGGWTEGTGNHDQDRGSSAFAVLCFLGYGCTDSYPTKYADCVRKGLDYLISRQNADGSFTGTYIDYTQGLATMALCDALSMGMERVRPYAQKAFDYLVNRQGRQLYCGFAEASNSNDMSATGWGYQGLVSARRAGLNPTGSYPSSYYAYTQGYSRSWATIDLLANTMFNMCIQVNKSSLGYADDYHTVYVYNSNGYAQGSTSQHRMTSANLAMRMLWGHRPTGDHSPRTYSADENCYNQLQWVMRTVSGQSQPEHMRYLSQTPDGCGGISGLDLYTVYYQTIDLWYVGGATWDAYRAAALAKIVSIVNADGSCPTNYAPYAADWGGVPYPTALACLSLEIMAGDYTQGTKWAKGGDYSYGYNPKIGDTAVTATADNVILMDYTKSIIEPTEPAKYAAPRHGGKANVLFGDGTVRQLDPATITPGMLTPKQGD